MIVIDNLANVKCGEDANSLKECNPLELFASCAECGDCPIIALGEKYWDMKLDGLF